MQVDQGPSSVDPFKIAVKPGSPNTFATGQLSIQIVELEDVGRMTVKHEIPLQKY
jgi:WD40 repeat protein